MLKAKKVIVLGVMVLGGWIWPRDLSASFSREKGGWSSARYASTFSAQEHYDWGVKYLYENHWDVALSHFMTIIYGFQETAFFPDALFYAGICDYFKANFDLADRHFTQYLNLKDDLKHFETVFSFKFHIADYYVKGCRKHLFGFRSSPKWPSGKEDALRIYDEIIVALPTHDLAVKSIFGKAKLLYAKNHYKESIETLQQLTKSFPKHDLAIQAYLLISEIYLKQGGEEAQNPDLIALAQINLQNFRSHFPVEEQITIAEENVFSMRELLAQSLYDTGRFYEKKKKPHASLIYYIDAIDKYPGTQGASKCCQRLSVLQPEHPLLSTVAFASK